MPTAASSAASTVVIVDLTSLSRVSSFCRLIAVISFHPKHVERMLQQLIGIERLGDIGIGTHLLAALAVVLLPLGRQQHDIGIVHPKLMFDGMTDIEAVYLRHHNI